LTANYLSEKIPDKTFEIVPLTFGQIFDSVQEGKIDFVLANPAFYVELGKLYGINRIVTLKNRRLGSGYTKFGGVIFRNKDREDIQILDDLEGKSFMAVEETSFGGWRMAWRELKEAGIDPYNDFRELKFAGTHDAVVYAVRDGHADAGTVRTDTLERMQSEGKINLQEFFVIPYAGGSYKDFPFSLSTRLYPEWPMAKVRHISDGLAKQVSIALLEMSPDTPAAIAAKCASWTIPMNYQPVNECLKELKVGPYKDLGKITLSDVVERYWHLISIFSVLFLTMTGAVIVILILNKNIKMSHTTLKAEVTERKKAEEKTKDSEQRMAQIIDFLPDPTWVVGKKSGSGSKGIYCINQRTEFDGHSSFPLYVDTALFYVSRQLGHRTISFTAKRYYHWILNSDRSRVNQSDNMILVKQETV